LLKPTLRKKLQKRKALLTYIVKESIKAERNILQVSNARSDRLLNVRSQLFSKVGSLSIKLLKKSSISGSINRVYTSQPPSEN